jgi:hypothetical protein
MDPSICKVSLPTLMETIMRQLPKKCTIRPSKETSADDDNFEPDAKKQKRANAESEDLLLWFGYPPSTDIAELSYQILHKRTLKLVGHYHPDKGNTHPELCSIINAVIRRLPSTINHCCHADARCLHFPGR